MAVAELHLAKKRFTVVKSKAVPKTEEVPRTGLKPLDWIYNLTKDEEVGPGGKQLAGMSAYAKANGNFQKTLRESTVIKAGTRDIEIPSGTELVVYRKLTKLVGGGWNIGKGNLVLAAAFIKDEKSGLTTKQVTIKMNGHVRVSEPGTHLL